MKIDKEEIKAVLLASVVLGFVLSFRKWGDEEFSLITGLLNWGLYFLISIATWFVYILAQKVMARRHDLITSHHLWRQKKLWFSKKLTLKREIPLGIILSVILTFISFGYIKFAGMLETKMDLRKDARLTKRFRRTTELESALVAVSGPMFVLFLSSLISIYLPKTPFVETMYVIALSSLIPIGLLDGVKAAFGSLPLYLTALLLTLIIIPVLISGIVALTVIATIILFLFLIFLFIMK